MDLKNARIAGVTQAGRACGYLREYMVRLSRRTRDCGEDLRCRGLLLTGLRKLSLKLLERSATNVIWTRHRNFRRHGSLPNPMNAQAIAEPNAILR